MNRYANLIILENLRAFLGLVNMTWTPTQNLLTSGKSSLCADVNVICVTEYEPGKLSFYFDNRSQTERRYVTYSGVYYVEWTDSGRLV